MDNQYFNITQANTPRIAKFSKVPFEQFLDDYTKQFKVINPAVEAIRREIYDAIELPKRSTKGSNGYDFKSPISFRLKQNETIVIPTGIRCKMAYGWGLFILPRSGQGFKYRVQLDNTIGDIDADYFESSNYGHIMIKITCDTKDSTKCLEVEQGGAFAQGVFLPHGLTVDDDIETQRDGGLGSTDCKSNYQFIATNSDGTVDTKCDLCETCLNTFGNCEAQVNGVDFEFGMFSRNVYACNHYNRPTLF